MAIFAFTCTCCGRLHEGSPSVAYSSPWHYSQLTDDEKTSLAKIDSDLCRISSGDQTDYFVRCVLEIPIHGVDDPFIWGVWSSLSEKSFRRYVETYNEPVNGDVRISAIPDSHFSVMADSVSN
ncbi:DUF2199 domain-containing protein [Roseateles sp. SL47]|uniref:DUF2199 domain-containing protein n=1 Tax=Roseateles sp. SL47 TaxID=2995138 RepID=UPI00226F14CA|nr:DUF2199 domain-containing protein [Roseateles sp. SL47]WAC73760.1 DUF2199 domain-containing protein [Roseateles sp. SL47]